MAPVQGSALANGHKLTKCETALALAGYRLTGLQIGMIRWGLLGYVDRMIKSEGHEGLSRQHNLLITCEGRTGRAGASSGQRTNRSALTAPGNATDHGAQAGASADQTRGTLALALLSLRDAARGDG